MHSTREHCQRQTVTIVRRSNLLPVVIMQTGYVSGGVGANLLALAAESSETRLGWVVRWAQHEEREEERQS